MTDTFVLLKGNSILVPFLVTGLLHSKKPSILQKPSVASQKTVDEMELKPYRNDKTQPSVNRKRTVCVWLEPSNEFFSTSGQAEATIEGAEAVAEPKGDYNPDERKIPVEITSGTYDSRKDEHLQENERFTELEELLDGCHIEMEEVENTKSVKEWLKDPGLYKVLSTKNLRVTKCMRVCACA